MFWRPGHAFRVATGLSAASPAPRGPAHFGPACAKPLRRRLALRYYPRPKMSFKVQYVLWRTLSFSITVNLPSTFSFSESNMLTKARPAASGFSPLNLKNITAGGSSKSILENNFSVIFVEGQNNWILKFCFFDYFGVWDTWIQLGHTWNMVTGLSEE